jgi:hypothetical protein
MPNAEAGSFKINYDPLVMADGIQPTNDPVLLFRSPSYATSFTRRLRGIQAHSKEVGRSDGFLWVAGAIRWALQRIDSAGQSEKQQA